MCLRPKRIEGRNNETTKIKSESRVAKENQLRAAGRSFVEIKDPIKRSLKPHCVQGLAVCHNRCYTAPPRPLLEAEMFLSQLPQCWLAQVCHSWGTALGWRELLYPLLCSLLLELPAPSDWWRGPSRPSPPSGQLWRMLPSPEPFVGLLHTVQPHSIKTASLLSEQYQPLEHHQ